MSNFKYEIIKCSRCGNEQKFKRWNSINVTLDKEEKKRVLVDGSIFKFR